MLSTLRLCGLLCALLCAAPAAAQDFIQLDEVVDGLLRPVGITHAGDGSGRLFIVEQGGRC
jgi:hypothetical protein